MDFVPAQQGSRDLRAPSRKKVVGNPQRSARKATTVQKVSSKKRVQSAPMVQSAKVLRMSERKVIRLNEREDLNRKFVNRDVPKRPLSSPERAGGVDELERARMMAMRKRRLAEARAAKVAQEQAEQKQKKTERKSPFINQGAVEKRPLSGKVTAVNKMSSQGAGPRGNEEIKGKSKVKQKKGPETIIAKPEKQSHAGMIVAVILTIILGAAAGTVAFLLLPK